MAWVLLAFAGLFEIVWALGLKRLAAGITPPLLVLTAASMIVSLALLALALRSLPLGPAYAVWTGIGTLGTALAAAAFAGEGLGPTRLAAIGLIVAGIATLKLDGG